MTGERVDVYKSCGFSQVAKACPRTRAKWLWRLSDRSKGHDAPCAGRSGSSVKRGRRHADVHTSQAELSNWQVRTILGDQLRTRTEQKEACGARDDSSVLQAASSIKPPQAKIDAAAACLDRQRIDLQRNTVAKHA